MSAAEIAAALGAAHRSAGGGHAAAWRTNSRGPALALKDGDRGLIVCCHAGCDPRDVVAELPPAQVRP
jgi:hypothetical protein